MTEWTSLSVRIVLLSAMVVLRTLKRLGSELFFLETATSVFCASPCMVRWVESSNGCVPVGAVPAGNTVQGETLYVGRAKYQGSLTPGKIPDNRHHMNTTTYRSSTNYAVAIAVDDDSNFALGSSLKIEAVSIFDLWSEDSLIHPSHKVMYMSYGGQEIPHNAYEVLCAV
ncbi:hypothetical protein EVAR_9584_1 [Eumeta japonica]|uniref:Uncharacterized protein n=1 Tax=Eumeta variegata TaxID=151549 RepID=A0A4C1TJK9_EUMVA|nr:hypothetical protein EVAR_9584_1 [Eumeta japonica]